MTRVLAAVSTGVVALLASAACTVNQADTPPASPAGPSDFAQSITVTAIPDRLTQDGASQSAISVRVVGATGQPASGVPIRVDILSGGQVVDFGTLSTKSIVTGSDGRANAIYTAPPAPPATQGGLTSTVTIRAIALGNNAQTATPFTADIRLVPPGVILPPAGTPSPCILSSPAQPSAQTPVQFTAGTSSGGVCGPAASDITSFAWSFGDGGTATGRAVTHTFTTANAYSVTLTETNDRGVSGSTTQSFVIGSATLPTAVFTFSPAAPGINQAVFFNAANSTAGAGHTIASYSWSFGDGQSGSGLSSSHAFGRAGSFTVTLTVTDEAGQTASSALIVAVGNPTLAPTFTISPAAPGINETVSFNAAASSAGTGHTITSYEWTFGDNTAVASGIIVTHQYATAGSYVVTLRITNEAGETATTTQTIAIGSPPSPTAGFTFSPTNPVIGQSVTFDAATSSTSQGQTIARYEWNFGDGTPITTCPGNAACGSSNRTISHSFATAQIYTVNLVVTDSAGRVGRTSLTVNVSSANPTARLTLTKAGGLSINADGSASTGTGTSTITTYSFNWGDNSGSTSGASSQQTHTYTLAGSYTVVLTVTDSSGRSATASATITVP